MKPPTSTSIATAPQARTRSGSFGAGVSGTSSSISLFLARALGVGFLCAQQALALVVVDLTQFGLDGFDLRIHGAAKR